MTATHKKLALAAMLAILLTPFSASFAGEWESWCSGDEPLGWDFYCDPAERKTRPAPAKAAIQPAPTPPPAPAAATEELEALQAEVQEARARAVLYPNEENVHAYLVLQSGLLVKAASFADHWRRVVWQNPELDYEGAHPQSNLGKRAARKALHDTQHIALDEIAENYALIYVGTAQCAVCRVYGPDLRRFAEKYGFSVLPVSADGSQLSGFAQATTESGQLERLGITDRRVPLSLLYHRRLDQVTILGVGYLAEQELINRIYALMRQEVGDAF